MGRDFYERFDLHTDIAEAKQRFINRAINAIFLAFVNGSLGRDHYPAIRMLVATKLGIADIPGTSIAHYVENKFENCLQAIEVIHESLPALFPRTADRYQAALGVLIQSLLEQSEVDLGVTWDNGKFTRSGAKLLDDRLVNDPLKWLREKEYYSVIQPYEKALHHFLESENRPELLADVITDAYEALESMAKIVTGRNNDLSSTREQFLTTLGLSTEYRRVLDLREYVRFGCIYRHGANQDIPKPKLTAREVESFLYQTGIYLRLAAAKDAKE